MAAKHASPEDVLTLHINPSNKYMAHFFHFAVDVPVMRLETKGGKNKAVYDCKMEVLRLSDIDAITKKHVDLKGRLPLGDIALTVLSGELLDQLEATKLDIEETIKWASIEAKAKLEKAPKAGKAAKALKPKTDPEVLQIANAMRQLAPEASPAALKASLVRLVGLTEKVDAAEDLLVKWETANPRVKGYILSRTRTKNKAQ